ncbi:MAG: OB-fold nucleic acid binding domain-containing protein, partial [Bacteroidetes bacterium]|nr:OB-fold nucleic acid binding domain-containing protein [Bacteroidota bacterium]
MKRELSEQEQWRREERLRLKQAGINPYAYHWDVTALASDILSEFDDDRHQPTDDGVTKQPFKVSIAGRIMSKRIMGKASFFHLQDSSGQIQIYLRRDDLPEGFYNQIFKKLLDIGDIVGIEGFVFRTKMGEVSVHAQRLELLTKSLRPLPVVKELDGRLYNEVTDKEFRYRQRYADLIINPDVRGVFRERAKMVTAIRRFLDDRGYLEV